MTEFVGDYINGQFVAPPYCEVELTSRSPADQADILGVCATATAQVERAVDAAHAARKSWGRLTFAERARYLQAFQERLRDRANELSMLLAREVGKALWDAKSEVSAMVAKIDMMLTEGVERQREQRFEELPGSIRYRPLGVMAIIGPFNFPGHLPNGQWTPALLLGNTVVFKPSDKTPCVGRFIAELVDQAGFPPGVFNVVQGGGAAAQKLIGHTAVTGVFFTGSPTVGASILRDHGADLTKLIALELGGKNGAIVLPDANVEESIRHIAFAAFATAGQRCTATSLALVARPLFDEFCEKMAYAARHAAIGYPLDPGVFLGPVISNDSMQRGLQVLQHARAHGFAPAAQEEIVEVEGRHGFYLRPSVYVASNHDAMLEGYTDEELFIPHLTALPIDELRQGIEYLNQLPYGLSAAVFSSNRESFETAAEELEVGVLHWNRGTAGASGQLPFGGVKRSGNYRPAGLFAGANCVYPQAVLETPLRPAPLAWTGLTFKGEES